MIGWQPGIDIKAHPNNYVVVAPSEGCLGKIKIQLSKLH